MISPTHKRIEGRTPVWGSEFTSKAATPRGTQEIEHKIWNMACGDWMLKRFH